MRSLAWLSEKGGTGKTTSCLNTAACLARMKKRVLVIDADPQANSTLVLLQGQTPDPPTLYHVLTNTADAGDTIRKTSIAGLDLLPGDTILADANVTLAGEIGRERRLRLAMRGVDEAYDFVVIDTSPQRTLININVLNYVSEVWCPVDPGIFSLSGLVKLQGAVGEVVKFLDNATLRLAGLVLTQVRSDNLTKDVESQLRAQFGALVCTATIPASIKVGEAHSHYLSVLDYAPRSPGAKAYEALTREILSHGEINRTGTGGKRADKVNDSAGRRKRAG
jgi:chromosome partitioning protein